MGFEWSCTKTKLLNETMTDEKLTVAAFKETEFEYQEESEQYSIFIELDPRGLLCKELNALFDNQWTVYQGKNVDWYPDERAAASSFEEQKVCFLHLQAISLFFVSNARKVSQNTFMHEAEPLQKCGSMPVCENFKRLLWKQTNCFIERNHRKVHFQAFSPCQVSVVRNRTQ